ncbi:MAG TPA: SRPBCC family protein [Solirubrobacteraceae bacterium]|nr:SRPBCC family protein [Solirubrobacteraceae bacterium]
MKELRGQAAGPVSASGSECFALLLAIERYPAWYPDVVRRAEVTQRDSEGQPSQARATVHLGIGPVRRDFELNLQVTTVPERLVRLSRVPHAPSDPEQFVVAWQIDSGPSTRLAVELRASLEVPRLLPLQGIGESVAQGFLAAAQAELARTGG